MPSKPLAKLLPRPAVRPGAAATALVAFVEVTGMEYQDALPNLLADLMHWCDRKEEDFAGALDVARAQYEAEKTA